jgi:hypothetical protein
MWTPNAAQANAAAPLLPAASAAAPVPASASGSGSASGVGGSAKAFSQVLQQAQGKSAAPAASAQQHRDAVTVATGDTLIGLVRDQAQARGVQLSSNQEMRLAQQLASANGIGNADLVYPGQNIALSSIHADLQGLQTASLLRADAPMQSVAAPFKPSIAPAAPIAGAAAAATIARRAPAASVAAALRNAPLGYDVRSPQFTSAAQAVAKASTAIPVAGAPHPVLQQTLDRAVAKGFIPAAEKTAVYDKILQMADNHRFSPDDFARMTLMESDGMNPRASNQRCHGIIQFCDGPARGAASAGYGANPKAILDLSVHKQLSLVDKYFDDVGLKSQGPAGLEDLYLSVLNPASRAQSQINAPLNIGGQQARALHVGSDTSAPITRHSIRQGLLQNAAARLGQMLPTGLRVQAQRAQQYVENNLP